MKTKEGYLEGEVCNRDGCKGIIEERDDDRSCSCHINPPCSSCETAWEFCPECDWYAEDEQNEYQEKLASSYTPPKPKTAEELQKIREERYAKAKGKKYSVKRYFDSMYEATHGSNLTLEQAENLVRGLRQKPAYYVSYSLEEQKD